MGQILDWALEYLLPLVWDSIWFWRILGLVSTVTLVTLFVWRERLRLFLIKPGRMEHDRHTFKEADNILGEAELEWFLGNLGADHSFLQDMRRPVSAFCKHFSRSESRYLSKDVQKKTENLVDRLNNLLDFKAEHFHIHELDIGHENPRIVMEPRLRGQRNASDEYRKLAQELNELLDEVEEAYREYRLTVKNRLQV